VVYLSLGASWPAVNKKRVARREEDWLGFSGASPTSVLLILLDYSGAAMARKQVIDLVPLRLPLGMRLFLLDALSAIGEAEALIFLFKLFFLGVLPIGLLLAYWRRHIGRQFDRELKQPGNRPLPSEEAGSGGLYLLLLVLARGFVGILAVALLEWR
jgi:hypothetical protein